MNGAHEKIVEYLTANGVAHRVITHPPAGSAEEYHRVLGTSYEQQAKSIFLRVRRPGEKTYAILVIQAQKRADPERAAALLEAREVKLATRDHLRERTGCDFGELAPLGGLYGFPLLLDADLLDEEEIYFNAGDLSTSVALSPKSLQELENPLLY
ncbi:YbaK/EbsC family protein [Bailinhaonella thermotolerans]|uniref:YbaK/aminoacyl-tRNA synthetase-associated domain-containing protein n=1 Tax=Bailinhaonella thermotolerans TaxID=1070861 RepID=A0A3A4B2S8_9ACTN|nr:YbaK/EbsC family protein [Bailinhaonella thermotolerans]RJL36025.1 hypothetical protein D5H75_04505 [Bailinhaonella thermotolerans]